MAVLLKSSDEGTVKKHPFFQSMSHHQMVAQHFMKDVCLLWGVWRICLER